MSEPQRASGGVVVLGAVIATVGVAAAVGRPAGPWLLAAGGGLGLAVASWSGRAASDGGGR